MKVAKSLSQSYTIIIWHLELLDKLPSSLILLCSTFFLSRLTSLADVTLDTYCGCAGQYKGGGRILCSKIVVDDLHRTEKGSTRRVGFEPLHFLSSFTSLCSLPCVAAPSPGNLYPNDRMTDKILQRGSVHPKFQVDGFATTNHSFSQKTRLSDLLYGTKIWTDLSSFLPQSTRLTDRQTHRQNSHR